MEYCGEKGNIICLLDMGDETCLEANTMLIILQPFIQVSEVDIP
jgi:hypothetical protein